MRERDPIDTWRHEQAMQGKPLFAVGDVVTHSAGYSANLGVVKRVVENRWGPAPYHTSFRYTVQWLPNPHFKGHYRVRGRVSSNCGCAMMKVSIENLPHLQREAARRFMSVHPDHAQTIAALLSMEAEDHLANAPLD